MIFIPPGFSVPKFIQQGSVFHYAVSSRGGDGKTYTGERFFVVLNPTPSTSNELVMVTLTSKVAERQDYIARVGEDSATLVQITPSDFSALSKPTVGNCNQVYPITMEDLVKKIENGGKTFFDPLPKEIVEALVSGVLKSGQVSNEYKKKLL